MISYAGGDKEADIPYMIIDGKGNQILSGYEDAIWRTADGYAKLLFCDPGSEEESANVSGEYVDYRGLFQEGNGGRDLSVSWETVDDGFLVYDQGGNQIGHIRIENSEEYQLVVVDDQLLGLGRPDAFSFQRLYAVGSGE